MPPSAAARPRVPRGLVRSDCAAPGIVRRRRGRGWSYVDARTGAPVSDLATRERFEALAIPPAWRDVWICPDPRGHLQAVGTDAAGRRQYLYHPRWRARRDVQKFDRLTGFARRLPAFRERCDALLDPPDASRDCVLACAGRLLDLGFFRIGGERYAADNGSYGLTTLRREHVRIADGTASFDYVAKGGKERVLVVAVPQVVAVLEVLRRRRTGPDDLLAYRDDAGAWVDVKDRDVNEFLKRELGPDVSAKDFRTWGATALASVALAVSGDAAATPTGRKRAEARACTEVAHYLGNTPAVARASYIDPRVFDRYRSGWTIAPVLQGLGAGVDPGHPSIQGVVEAAVLDLLEDRRDSEHVDRIEAA